ncbi:uncharacterized protein LOC143226326 [Tachypleus tridentatus]|uniref:uncharacterized protein LOC143226326 n=1 Tax=Tachypleus tridentatus TaxID=6853 RepID=UPI003FD41FB9
MSEGLNTQIDASTVLAKALEQMDDIIAGRTYDCSFGVNGNHSTEEVSCQQKVTGDLSITDLLLQLKTAIEQNVDIDNNENNCLEDVDAETKIFIIEWLQQATKDYSKNRIQCGKIIGKISDQYIYVQ